MLCMCKSNTIKLLKYIALQLFFFFGWIPVGFVVFLSLVFSPITSTVVLNTLWIAKHMLTLQLHYYIYSGHQRLLK